MEDFITHFIREPDGAWRCLSFAEVRIPSGRIQVAEGTRFVPGTVFMGMDIVKYLDEEFERLSPERHSSPSLPISSSIYPA